MSTKIRLKQLIDEFGKGSITGFAEYFKVNPKLVHHYLSGHREPGNKFRQRLAKNGVSMHWFETGQGDMVFAKQQIKNAGPTDKNFINVPLLSNITCGKSLISQIDENEFLPIYETTHRGKNIIAVKVDGDSMREYIRPKDVLLCYKHDSAQPIKNNKAYVIDFTKASVDSKEGMCKLVHRLDEYRFMLISINTYFEPIIVHKRDIRALYKVYKIIRGVS